MIQNISYNKNVQGASVYQDKELGRATGSITIHWRMRASKARETVARGRQRQRDQVRVEGGRGSSLAAEKSKVIIIRTSGT